MVMNLPRIVYIDVNPYQVKLMTHRSLDTFYVNSEPLLAGYMVALWYLSSSIYFFLTSFIMSTSMATIYVEYL